MRVQCDVCEKNLAALLCCADEAALCTVCDLRVHAANKLANKHQRVPFLPTTGESPTCDICQEKSAFFFCLEDRALLCRDCDVSIHLPNTLSAAHKRFLLTGTRVALEAVPNDADVPAVSEEPKVAPSQRSSGMSPQLPGNGRLSGGKALQNQYQTVPLAGSIARASTSGAQPSGVAGGSGYGHMRGSIGLESSSGVGLGRRGSYTDLAGGLPDPGWRVDELLNIPELADGYTLGDIGSSKAEVDAQLGDFDWTADLSLFDEQVYAESLHEVPSLPPPPSTNRVPSALKGRARHDAAVVPDYDDAFVVPDIGLQASPRASKRRRDAM